MADQQPLRALAVVSAVLACACAAPAPGALGPPSPPAAAAPAVRAEAAATSAEPEVPTPPAVAFGGAVPSPPPRTPLLGTVAGSKAPALRDPGELPSLRAADASRKPLPLEHTDVRARLTGLTADVEVSQTYQNPSLEPIEVVYVFPLPDNSAVDRMRMRIGDRAVEARIDERRGAARRYAKARREGRTAALVEEERSNVFTQSVANVAPKSKIEVVVHYLQDLAFDAGEYELVFPMVVGPRFVQGAPTNRSAGRGTSQDSSDVPDASRVSPPILPKGERSGRDISLEVIADLAPQLAFEVPTHEVVTRRPGDGTVRLSLADKRTIPNRNFVLRYRASEDRPKATLLTSGAREGFFSLIVDPPALDVDALVGRRELVFVVDVSGSMRGAPLALCKSAIRQALSKLRPGDTFNVITFAAGTGRAFPLARPASDANIREALGFVERMSAGGGTMILDAVAAALGADAAAERDRYVFFLTDGYVAVEDQIMASTRRFVAALEARGRRARVFGFGVGSSPNRALIEGLSREGKGAAVYATTREDPARAVNRFYRYIDSSVLRDVKVDWGDLAPTDVVPRELPDLFASHPLVIHGRYRGAATRPLVVRATAASGPVEIPVTVAPPAADESRAVLGTLWARSKIGWLEGDLASGAATAGEIQRLGLEFHLVTRFTSLVAIDGGRPVGAGASTTIVQPTEAPEDLERDEMGSQKKEAPAPTVSDLGREVSLTPMAPDRGPRGCNCRLEDGQEDAGWAGAWAVAFVLAAASRRARRGARG